MPVGQRFGQMKPFDGLRSVEIGNGAGDFQAAVIAAGTQPELVGSLLHQGGAGRIQHGNLFEQRRRTGGIGGDVGPSKLFEPVFLPLPRFDHPLRHLFRAFRLPCPHQIMRADGGYFDVQVDPVEQGSRQAALIKRHAFVIGRAFAGKAGFVGQSATAGIHGGHQLETRRIGNAVIGAGDDDFTRFQRLAQAVEHLRLEFRQFVEKQNAVMGQRGFTRFGPQAAADQSGHRSGMVGGAEGTPVCQAAARQSTRDRMDHRHVQQFFGQQGWQNRRQTGSYVPASRAHIGLVDRLFSRVGAADDLARGRSTFMVEMIETAAILNQATERSLVILDEIGRGTATYDGLSIAWATIEHLHEQNRCRGLFATHFHELTALAKKLDRLHLLTLRVTEYRGDVVFLHEVISGVADRSYGIQVAKLAGLPPAVINRAQVILTELETQDQRAPIDRMVDDLPLFSVPVRSYISQTQAPNQTLPDPLRKALQAIDPDSLTPREALDQLYQLISLGKAAD